jgi:acyl-coenzyme A synthetase/AMP-(fatty) acid ligase
MFYRVALFYPPSVIAGLRMLLGGLMAGAALEVLPPRILGRTALAQQIRARGITLLGASPTLFRHLADALPAGACFDDLRLVVLGGERVDWNDFDVFRRACLAQAEMMVHLGATECWTLHTQWRVDSAVRATCPRLPVGRAIPGRRVDLVGEDGEVVAEGEAGDLVRRRADGLVEFIGRKDNQIKLRGYRIEPDEVESALKACSGVRDAAVIVRTDRAGVPMALAGYVQLRPGERALTPERLGALLGERVPPYMMPAEIRILDELPWLPNFKIDRKRLAQIDAGHLDEHSQTEASPLIGELIATFELVTKASGVRPSDNILSLGGDSLQALELMLEIGRRFRVVVPEQAQDPTRTVSQWARDIAGWRSLDAARWTG